MKLTQLWTVTRHGKIIGTGMSHAQAERIIARHPDAAAYPATSEPEAISLRGYWTGLGNIDEDDL